MPGIARMSVDSAGGTQLNGNQSFARCEGELIITIGDRVASHPPVPPHTGSPVMVEGSSFARINGIPICREGDQANCGHPSTGSSNMRIDS